MAHEWRTHPKLVGRFLPQYPDDLQVIVHDGSRRLTSHQPEIVWVRVSGCDGDLLTGRVLNQPAKLTTVRQGQEGQFLIAAGAKFPVMVTTKYLAEKGNWMVHPCQQCGFAVLFDAPSDLIRAVFPDLSGDFVMESFTSFCPLCGGVQVIQHVEEAGNGHVTPRPQRRSWQFWK